MKNFKELVRFAREGQGVRQAALARQLGLSQAALSQYENSQGTLSQNTLSKIASALKINPAYLSDASLNPFKSSEIIRMYFPEHILAGMDYSTLEDIVELNSSLEVTFLIATSRSVKIDSMISRTIIGEFTLGVLLQDQDKNLYLFRRKRKGAYLVGVLNLQARLREIADRDGKKITINTIRIPRALSRKIYDLSAARSDFEDLLHKRDGKGILKEEQALEAIIEEIKEGAFDPIALWRFLQGLKARGLDIEDIEEILRKRNEP